MNSITERGGTILKSNAVAIAISTALFLLLAWAYAEMNGHGPLLKNNPCAPGYRIIVNGEDVGCTNDEPSGETWNPNLRDK